MHRADADRNISGVKEGASVSTGGEVIYSKRVVGVPVKIGEAQI